MNDVSIQKNESSAVLTKTVTGRHTETSTRHSGLIKLDVDNAVISTVQTQVVDQSDTNVFILKNTIKHPANVITFDFISDGRVPSRFSSEVTFNVIFSLKPIEL